MRALDATIGFSYDREQLADLAAELPVAGMLDLEAPSDQKMRLRVTAEEWRLELDEPTLFGSGMTLIRHADGSGEYLDHGTRTRLVIPAADVPAARVGRAGSWRVEADEQVVRVVLDDPVTGARWTQRIVPGVRCDDEKLASSFVRALLAGGASEGTSGYPVEELAAVLVERGLPSEVALFTEGSDVPASRMTLEIADGESDAPDPDGYRDMRDESIRKQWEKPGPGLRELAGRDLDALRAYDDEQDEPRPYALRMRRDDDDVPDRDPPERPPRDPNRPPRTITTNAAQVALRIEQALLDDVRRTVNAVAAHLTGASTSGTELLIPWLEQSVDSARALAPPDANGVRPITNPGTGLPALLHEDPGSGAVKRAVTEGGRGLIDLLAIKRAGEYMTAGAVPPHVLSALQAADIAPIATALALPTPASRLSSLTPAVRTRLIAAIAFDDIGTLRFSLAGLRDPITVRELYYVQLIDFRLTLGLPPATVSTTTPPAPLEAPVITELRCRAGGSIDAAFSIANLGVDATMVRTGTPLYWALLVAGAPVIAVFMPQFAWVIPVLWTISIFLATDVARLRLDCRPLTITAGIGFAPRPGSAALRPRVTARLRGTVRARMLSYVPDGIHQVVDWAVADFATNFGIVLSVLESQFEVQLQGVLDRLMGSGVPGSLQRLVVPVASGTAAGADDDHVYLESTFGTPADPAVRITPVPVSAALRFDLDRDIDRVFGTGGGGGRGRHYLSVGASINAVNQTAAVLWRRGELNSAFAGSAAAALRPLLAGPFSGNVARIETSHQAAPVFSLPAGGPTGPGHHFDVVFPAFVVWINRGQDRNWGFRFRISGRGVFGFGAIPPPNGRFLAIAGIRPNVYEAMLDLSSMTATLIEATELELQRITVREAGDDPRHPQAIHTHVEVVEEQTDRTPGAPASWSAYGRGIFALANWFRDVGLVPRLDQRRGDGSASTWPLDGTPQQTYGFDGSDPDDATATIQGVTVEGYAQVPIDWGFNQGLTFAHAEASGALRQLLSGSPHINSFQTVDAQLLYAFLARLPL
jgi:hypothetical protein